MIDKNKVKAIIFDWGGVCCAEGEPFASLPLQRVLSMTPEEIAGKAGEIYSGYYEGVYNKETFWRSIMKHFSLSETDDINPGKLSDAYLSSYVIYPPVMETIFELKRKYRIGLLSNLTPEMRDHIRDRHHVGNYFEVEVYSCDEDLKKVKPKVEPYQLILRKLNLAAAECLFIDNSRKNLRTAEAMGMQVLFFQNPDDFLRDISIFL